MACPKPWSKLGLGLNGLPKSWSNLASGGPKKPCPNLAHFLPQGGGKNGCPNSAHFLPQGEANMASRKVSIPCLRASRAGKQWATFEQPFWDPPEARNGQDFDKAFLGPI